MEQYKISVIIPIYNVATYLPRCLTSILDNNYRNIEVICIDDGSTDDSARVLKNFAEKDSRIQIVTQENKGVSAARNRGLLLATGEYISFVDSDDWVHRDYFKFLLSIAIKNSADIVVCREKEIYDDTNARDEQIYELKDKSMPFAQAVTDNTVRRRIWGRIYSRNIFKNHYFVENIKLAEDLVFNMDVMASADVVHVAYCDQELYYYRIRANSAVRTLEGTEILPVAQWYLSNINKVVAVESKAVFLIEAFKASLSFRYSVMFLGNDEKRKARELVDQCYRELIKAKYVGLPIKVQYIMLSRLSVLYRIFRIVKDPSLIAWERHQREKQKRIRL